MGPRAKLQIEPGRSSREPPLDYQRWTKIGLSSRLPEPVPGCPGPWALGYSVLPLPRGNRRLSMGIFFCRLFFQYSSYRRFIWVSAQAFIFCTTSCVEKTGNLFLLVVSNPISRAHQLSAPTKEPLRSFQQQNVQPSLVRLATKPQLLCTNALRCASANSHGSNAFHCCTYPSCGTCPTLPGGHTTIFKSRINRSHFRSQH